MFGFMVIDLAQAIEADRRRQAHRAERHFRRRSS
jgi:hypothetical protein